MIVLVPVLFAFSVAVVLGLVARFHPASFGRACEVLRNVGLIAGIVMLVWNVAVVVTVLSLDAGGLLVAGGFYEAGRIGASLQILGSVEVVLLFGTLWVCMLIAQNLFARWQVSAEPIVALEPASGPA